MNIYKEWESYFYDDEETFIYIFKVELARNSEEIFHIFIINKYTNEYIIHFPVSREAFEQTPLKKIEIEEIYFDKNNNWYHIWKQEYDKWQAWIWRMNISQIIRSLFFAMHKQ